MSTWVKKKVIFETNSSESRSTLLNENLLKSMCKDSYFIESKHIFRCSLYVRAFQSIYSKYTFQNLNVPRAINFLYYKDCCRSSDECHDSEALYVFICRQVFWYGSSASFYALTTSDMLSHAEGGFFFVISFLNMAILNKAGIFNIY